MSKILDRILRARWAGTTVASTGAEVGRLPPRARRFLRLRSYQQEGVSYLRRAGGCGALFWEMRLGKSITTIRFLSQRADARRVLVVSPYSALPGWEEELSNENKVVFAYYRIPANKRDEDFPIVSGDGWYLINKEEHLRHDILARNWDAVVMDETWISNPKAKVTKYFLKNTRAKYRILLTGTPAPESELQYYCQLYWINPKILNCKSYWDFRIRYFRPEGMEWAITLKGRQRLAGALALSCNILKRSDAGLSKEKIMEKRVVRLSNATRKKYSSVELGLYEDKILKFAGERWVEMRRLCSGEEKEKELLTLTEGELKNERIIVWCDYVEEVERIANLLGCRFIHGAIAPAARENIRSDFLTKGRALVAQPQCWKWGTNLTGVDIVIFYSLPTGLMTWQQVQERTVDLSSDKSLLIISLLAENTVDEDILESLYAKETREKMLDRIRRGIQIRLGIDD